MTDSPHIHIRGERHQRRVENGQDRFTLLVDPDLHILAGDEVTLATPGGDHISTESITLVAHAPAHWIPHWDFYGTNQDWRTTEDFIEELQDRHPKADLDRSSLITVVGW